MILLKLLTVGLRNHRFILLSTVLPLLVHNVVSAKAGEKTSLLDVGDDHPFFVRVAKRPVFVVK